MTTHWTDHAWTKQQPVTDAERVEWARAALEDAAHRLAHDPAWSTVNVAAVVGRSRELSSLRAIVEASPSRPAPTRPRDTRPDVDMGSSR